MTNFTHMPMRPIFPLTFALFMVLISACTESGNHYTKEVQSVDSLMTAVVEAKTRFDSLDHEAVSDALNTIKNDMASMQMTIHGDLDDESGRVFGEYDRAKRLIKDFPQRERRINEETERTIHQLGAFKSALESRASEDKEGNKITPEYVNKNYEIESRVASSLIEEIDNTIDYATRGMKKFHEIEPEVRALLEEWKQQ